MLERKFLQNATVNVAKAYKGMDGIKPEKKIAWFNGLKRNNSL